MPVNMGMSGVVFAVLVSLTTAQNTQQLGAPGLVLAGPAGVLFS